MMNGYPNPSNGNYQYHSNNVQSHIYPPNAQNLNYNTGYYNNNYDTQNQSTVFAPLTKNPIGSTLPPANASMYNAPGTLAYQDHILTNNVPPSVPHTLTQQQSYLPPLQPHIPYPVKQQQPQNTPTILSEHMKNLHINSATVDPTIDLMQTRNLFADDIKTSSNIPKTCFPSNCDDNVMQCTLNMVPMESSMLSSCRLPLGVHIQPFRDTDIMLVQTNTIVRCRSCRTYINPFVTLSDHQRRWHCNVCGRVNDIPDEFMYDPVTKTYGSPMKRPELMHSNIEYTANPDYTVRPPMATVYVFCLDVSQAAVTSGYLRYTCDLLIENLLKMPGDNRKQIAFLTYNSSLHYYQIQENSFKMIMWSDISEVDLPVSEDLLVNLNDRKETILEFLRNLPTMFPTSMDNGNCLGFVIQVAMKLITHNGGRITVVNASLPNVGPGTLVAREGKESDSKLIQPATEFYKSLALQCANEQISVDLFCINRQYSDIASFATICRHSSGGFHYYGHFKAVINENQRLESAEQLDFDRFTKDFRRYLTRKIGFEAVMRTRSSKGLDLTAFHGNLFMRSTNVIAIPVVNPDASYAIQFKINSSLSEWNYVIIQAALLYTTSDSDRRIRVHTLCLPLSSRLDQIYHSVNAPAIAGLIAKIAVDKCLTDGLSNVRDAFVNSLVDPLKVFNSLSHSGPNRSSVKSLLCPVNMALLAPFILGLLRNPAFREKSYTADERVAMLESLRSLPLTDILRRIYPQMVAVTHIVDNVPLLAMAHATDSAASSDTEFPQPDTLSLTSAAISRDGAFLMDVGECFYLFLGNSISGHFLKSCFGIDSVNHMPKEGLVWNFDTGSTVVCQRMAQIHRTMANRSLGTSLITVLPDCTLRSRILNYLVEDRMENAMSYYEFLKSVQSSVYS